MITETEKELKLKRLAQQINQWGTEQGWLRLKIGRAFLEAATLFGENTGLKHIKGHRGSPKSYPRLFEWVTKNCVTISGERYSYRTLIDYISVARNPHASHEAILHRYHTQANRRRKGCIVGDIPLPTLRRLVKNVEHHSVGYAEEMAALEHAWDNAGVEVQRDFLANHNLVRRHA